MGCWKWLVGAAALLRDWERYCGRSSKEGFVANLI